MEADIRVHRLIRRIDIDVAVIGGQFDRDRAVHPPQFSAHDTLDNAHQS